MASQATELSKFRQYVYSGDTDEAIQMIKDGKVDVSASDEQGMTPLMYAAMVGDYDVAKFVGDRLEKDSDLLAENVNGQTFLMVAVANGQVDFLRKLAPPDGNKWFDPTNSAGERTLMFARDVKTAQYLIELGSDVSAVDRQGQTVLMHAAMNGSAKLVEYLMEEHKLDPNAVSQYGVTALMLAWNGPVAKKLIEKGADIKAVDNAGMTVLMHAALRGNLDLVEMALENGVDPNARATDGPYKGMTALEIAEQRRRDNHLTVAEQRQFDRIAQALGTKDEDGAEMVYHGKTEDQDDFQLTREEIIKGPNLWQRYMPTWLFGWAKEKVELCDSQREHLFGPYKPSGWWTTDEDWKEYEDKRVEWLRTRPDAVTEEDRRRGLVERIAGGDGWNRQIFQGVSEKDLINGGWSQEDVINMERHIRGMKRSSLLGRFDHNSLKVTEKDIAEVTSPQKAKVVMDLISKQC